MEYQYKVTNFEANVTSADVKSGRAAQKVAAQLEIALQEHARDGWELQGQYQFDVKVTAGCFASLFGEKNNSFMIYQLVFRKPM
jgi:hypothetical protein